MKKFTLYLLVFALLLTAAVPFASATEASTLPGDVNGDGLITPMDVTVLRRYIVGGYGVGIALPVFTEALMEENETTIAFRPDGADMDYIPADANGDGEIGTADITVLRRYLVGGYGAELVPSPVFRTQTVRFGSDTTLYKTYGRAYLLHDGLNMLWPCDAVEITAECEGDVELLCAGNANETVYIRVYVDGAETGRFAPILSKGKITVATGLARGEHTIRIVRDSDISKSNYPFVLRSLSFKGFGPSVTAPAQKDLLIEYIGDSITSGARTLPDTGSNTTTSPVLSYAYLTSQALDADWRQTSRSGIAVVRTTATGGSCEKTMAQCYDYVNPFAPDEERIEFSFDRKADVVVFALGTNDGTSSVTKEDFLSGSGALIDQIRARNGQDVKIVVICNMMRSYRNDDLRTLAEQKGAYFLQTTLDNGGYDNSHPGAEGQAVIASELTAFLRTIL